MRTIRVSEINSFIFCQRAWWYQRQGVKSHNQAELAGGSEFHEQQVRQVRSAILLQIIAWCLIILALVGLFLLLFIGFPSSGSV